MIDSLPQNKHLALIGKSFISTRPVGKSKELDELLMQYGGELKELPMIELREISCDAESLSILSQIDKYSHIAFTSAYGFEFFYKKIKKHNHFEAIISNIKIASIGYKTSQVIKSYGLSIDFDANAKTGAEFADKFTAYLNGKNAQVIWATGTLSPNTLLNKVNKVACIKRLNLYENSLPDSLNQPLINKITEDNYDMIVAASPSALRNLFTVLNEIDVRLVCIGQTTALEAEKLGVSPLAIAEEPTAKGIANAILNYYKMND